MKLAIDKLLIRNFRSFGDIDGPTTHTVNLKNRGPVLICGEVDNLNNKSNGAGKTTIIEAIIWCLFGRLSDVTRPGDNIINWVIGKDCKVNIITADGYEIIRTKNFEGHSDLSIMLNGDHVDGSDATNANAQTVLNNLFNLDFNTFICSMFFGQSSGSFLSLGDSKKKEVIENLFGLTKLNYYSKVAKEKIAECDKKHEKIQNKISNLTTRIESIKIDINKYQLLSDKFESDRLVTIKGYQTKINELLSDNRKLIDIKSIEKSWDMVNKSNTKLDELKNRKDNLFDQLQDVINKHADIDKKSADIRNMVKSNKDKVGEINNSIKRLKEEKNKICPTCDRMFDSDTIDDKIVRLKNDNKSHLSDLSKDLDSLLERQTKADNKVAISNKLKDLIQSKIDNLGKDINKLFALIKKFSSGRMTISEATAYNKLYANTNNEIKKYTEMVENEKLKNNGYDKLMGESKSEIEAIQKQVNKHKTESDEIGEIASHYTYIHRAHQDKKNMRAYLISGSIPILNNRLAYYFNELSMDSEISFNKSLQIKSSKWSYVYHSGGEKKRVDLALMCALYDTFVSIHGQLSNILVLDEIDKELDKDGVDEYVRLVIDDLSNRIETILVISHKDDIDYAFPTQIKVKKENDISYLEQV